MYITQETSITFKLPDEYNLMMEFRRSNDLSHWKEHYCTGLATFSKTERYITGVKDILKGGDE